MNQIEIGSITVEVLSKDIKNLHLTVNPPDGKVRISAPERMELDAIRAYAVSKLGWIKKQQKKFKEQERETPREYTSRESHYLWGARYLLNVTTHSKKPTVTLENKKLTIHCKPDTPTTERRQALNNFYRTQIKQALPPLLKKWEQKTNLKVQKAYIQNMKTKWGSANPQKQTIRLNTELAKKPPQCLEYIVVHEILHFLEPTHNQNFRNLMKQYLPTWQAHRDTLNSIPVRHESWGY